VKNKKKPTVGVIMGSKSDWDIMKNCCDTLKSFNINYDVRVISAHRTPKRLERFLKECEKKDVKVIIAAAGGAAHLAGVIASMAPVPVIGVPMLTPDLGGLDSLYSIVQMPGGVPVAAVGIGKAGAKNAAILAIQILSTADKALKKKIIDYKKRQAEKVAQKDKKVKKILKKSKK